MFYKIKSVKPLENFILFITFENGDKKYYDIKVLSKKIPVFQELINDINLFNQVRIDVGGYGISWNSNLDLSCNELWNNGSL